MKIKQLCRILAITAILSACTTPNSLRKKESIDFQSNKTTPIVAGCVFAKFEATNLITRSNPNQGGGTTVSIVNGLESPAILVDITPDNTGSKSKVYYDFILPEQWLKMVKNCQ